MTNDALTALRLEPLTSSAGVVVHGVDLGAPLDEPIVEELRRVLVDRKVAFFRDRPATAAGSRSTPAT